MVDLVKFIKNNIPLCVGTLGIAIIGYLGYHAVRWIIHKSQHTEKVDQVAQKTLAKPPEVSQKEEAKVVFSSPSNQPVVIPVQTENKSQVVSSVKGEEKQVVESRRKKQGVMDGVRVSAGPINKGQGEYIAFRIHNGTRVALTEEEYEKIYQVLDSWSPAAIVNREGERAKELCERRDEIIRAKVKEIDPEFEVSFIPRTLYELLFIRKCIREDVKKGMNCLALDWRKERRKPRPNEKCWHLCYFDNAGDNQNGTLKNTAYRLNQLMVKTFKPIAQGFTFDEIRGFGEKEVVFLRNHYGSKCPTDCSWPGPTTNFNTESTRGTIQPMGIASELQAQIVMNALTLDCSELAQKEFILYRGAQFSRDQVISSADFVKSRHLAPNLATGEKEVPYSLSYGTGVFAGCVYDGGATAFYFMRKEPDAFALSVPFEQLNSSIFYIPSTNTLSQLYGHGELFHARSKAPLDFDKTKKRLAGVQGGDSDVSFLVSGYTTEKLKETFERHMSQAIQLGS